MNSLRLSPSHVSIFFPGACQWNSLAPGLLENKYYSLQHGTATLPPRERTEPEGKPHVHSHRTKFQFRLSRSQSMLLNAFTPCPHITPFIHLRDTSPPALQLCHYPPSLLDEHKQKRDGSISSNFSHLHGGTSCVVNKHMRRVDLVQDRVGCRLEMAVLPTGEASIREINPTPFHTLKEAQQLRF